MSNLAYGRSDTYNVKAYLLAAFKVNEPTVAAALKTHSAQEFMAIGQHMGSYAYYVGDKIAAENGWEENPDWDDTEEEEDDDDR